MSQPLLFARLFAAALLVFALPALAQPKPTLLHTPPLSAKADEQLRIEGSLIGANKIDKVFIKYRGPGEGWVEAPMELQYGDLFRGYIPADKVHAPGVEYYIEGVGFDRSRVLLFGSPQKPHRLSIEGGTREKTQLSGREDEPEEQPTKTKEEDPMLANDEPEETPPPSKGKDKKGNKSSNADDAFAEEEPAEPPSDEPKGKKKKTAQREEQPKEKEEPPPREEKKTKKEEKSASSTKKRTEFEEELLLYGAEDTIALATRHEESVTKVPAIASTYTRAQMRALGARNVFEVLDFVPGLSVSRDYQGFYRVGIRGLRADPEVLFLLNGHRMNNFYDGRALANLPIENIERIEVIRGPGSAVYGAGAFLGVVNIVTDTSEGLRVAASGGHYEAFTGHVSGAKNLGAVTLFGDGDVLSQYGYRAVITKDNLDTQTQTQGLRNAGEPAGLTSDRRFLLNFGGGLRWDGEKAGKATLGLRYMQENRAPLMGLFDTTPGSDRDKGDDSDLNWNIILADAVYEKPLRENLTFRARGYFDFHTLDRRLQLTPKKFRPTAATPVDPPDGVEYPGLQERTSLSTMTVGAEAAVDAALSETNRLTVGLNVDQQALPTFNYVTNYAVPDAAYNADNKFEAPKNLDGSPLVLAKQVGEGAAASRLAIGLYGQDQWTPVSRLSLTIGLRLDAVQLPKIEDGAIRGTQFVPSFNPRAAVVLTATDALIFKLLYQRAFRAPTVAELTENVPDASINQGRFEGNPTLRPATVDAFEFGADYIQAAGDAKLRMRANTFYENFLAPIARVDETGNIVPLDNRDGVRSVGFEGEARLEASSRANVFINAAYFRAIDTATAAQSQILTDTPQARLNTGASLPLGEYLNLDISLRYGVERRNNSRSTLELVRRYKIAPYTLVNAQLRTELIADRLEIALLAQNVFQQETFDDPPRPDRTPGLIPRQGFEAFGILRGNF